MGNTRRSWRSIVLAGLVAGLAIACGGESETVPSGAPPDPSTAPSPTVDPAVPARLEALYEWDPSAGPRRDLAADTRGCMSQSSGKGLPAVVEHMQCMLNLGWKTVRPQD